MKALPSDMSISSFPIATKRVWTDKRFWGNAQTEDARRDVQRYPSGSQDCLPHLRYACLRRADGSDVKLGFLNLMNEFDVGDGGGRMIAALEPRHRSHSLFDSAVVLFDHIIQIAVRPHKELNGQETLPLEFAHSDMRGGISVKGNLLRSPSLLNRLCNEALGRSNIAMFSQEKIDCLSFPIHRAVQIASFAFDPNVRFIAPPRGVYWSGIALPALRKFRDVPLDPTHNSRIR
jgi:hypothetical protein